VKTPQRKASEARPPELRRTILDASLDLISREGLEAFSMREVARRAGVSHQAPYHYFADREAILAELVAEGFQLLHGEMHASISDLETPAARLRAIGGAYVRFAIKRTAYFKLMFRSELVRAEDHDRASKQADTAFDLLVAIVNDVARKKYGKEDPALVLACWSLAHGLATLLLEGKLEKACGPGKKAQEASAESVLDCFNALVAGD
jgi:AcrR family transcriptional regulator